MRYVSAPAPVSDRTSSSGKRASDVRSFDVIVPSQPRKNPSGMETMPGFSSGNQLMSTLAGSSDNTTVESKSTQTSKTKQDLDDGAYTQHGATYTARSGNIKTENKSKAKSD